MIPTLSTPLDAQPSIVLHRFLLMRRPALADSSAAAKRERAFIYLKPILAEVWLLRQGAVGVGDHHQQREEFGPALFVLPEQVAIVRWNYIRQSRRPSPYAALHQLISYISLTTPLTS